MATWDKNNTEKSIPFGSYTDFFETHRITKEECDQNQQLLNPFEVLFVYIYILTTKHSYTCDQS